MAELTPEDRERIYEEEKARHEAQEKTKGKEENRTLKKDTSLYPRSGKVVGISARYNIDWLLNSYVGIGCLGVLALFVLMVIIVALVALFGGDSEKGGAPETTIPQSVPGPADIQAQIVCDKFKLLTKLKGASLELAVDTDLPDFTVVMVNVSRHYLQKGNTATYSCDYFSEESTIGKWKTAHSIPLDEAKWENTLRALQEEMSRFGAGFDVASISDNIDISMVVPIRQPDPRFGDSNSKLIGKRVSEGLLRVVEDEVELNYPMESPPVGKSPFPSLDPLNLDVGEAYVVSEKTPLMPALNPSLAAIVQQMKYIPKGGAFKVYEVRKQDGTPWYHVAAVDQKKKKIGSGWIYSHALIGQKLKAYK